MHIGESFRVAWAALTTHKVRALLTMVGIIIGVGSVIGMQAIGTGFSTYLGGQFRALGDGVIYITPVVDSGEDRDAGRAAQLTAEDAAALIAPGATTYVTEVAHEFNGTALVSATRDQYFYSVKAISPSHFRISSVTLANGRLFSDAEDVRLERVAVIGDRVATTLFGSAAAAEGQRIEVDGVGFEVIGVTSASFNQAQAQTGSFSNPRDEIYVPYRTGRARLFRNQMTARIDVDRITVQASSSQEVDAAIREVTLLLRERHRLTYQASDFTTLSVEQVAQQSQIAIAGFSLFLVVIGGISLLVGGIGIMNIMLVSVTQRTKEIGLRKAVGARRRDIMAQFLIEALVLSVTGGLIGVVLGYLLSFAGTYVLRSVFLLPDADAVVTPGAVLAATITAAIVGLVFGLFPAMRASRLDPIRALRTE